jgi:psiF repeat
MTRAKKLTAVLTTAGISVLTLVAFGANAVFAGDAPPANSAPTVGRHHDPAWGACKKQADDRKLEPGDARKEFMKSCMQSAKNGTPPAT